MARAFGSCFRLRNPFFQFCFDGVEIEARAALHRREFDEGLEFLAHYLLNEDEAPELVFEPVEILLCAVLRSVVGPACAFEWIEAQVGDVRHVRPGFLAQPAGGLVDEAVLVVEHVTVTTTDRRRTRQAARTGSGQAGSNGRH